MIRNDDQTVKDVRPQKSGNSSKQNHTADFSTTNHASQIDGANDVVSNLTSFHQFRKRIQGDGYTNFLVIRPDGTMFTEWFHRDDEPTFPNYPHTNIYFGIHTTDAPGTRWERAKKATVNSIRCLFSEIDGKDMVTPTDAQIRTEFDRLKADAVQRLATGELKKPLPDVSLHQQAVTAAKAAAFLLDMANYNALAKAHVEALDPKPSAIIFSGGGWHLYWFLAQTFLITNEQERERARSLIARWVVRVGGDEGAKSLAQVARPVGTHNVKPKYAPNFPTVRFVALDYSREYSIDHLESLLPALPAPRPQKAPQSQTPGLDSTPALTASTDAPTAAGRIITLYNASHPIREQLLSVGYTVAGDRFRRPGGSSGSVRINDHGKAFAYSSSDPLWNPESHAVSSYDVFLLYEHNGDKRAALHAAARELGCEHLLTADRDRADLALTWLESADLSSLVDDVHKPLIRGRRVYRSAHNDRKLLEQILEGMIKAGRNSGYKTSARQLCEATNSDAMLVAPMSPTTALASLTRLSFAVESTRIDGCLTLALRTDFFESIVKPKMDTPSFNNDQRVVSSLDVTTRTHRNDDAYLVGTSRAVKLRAKALVLKLTQDTATVQADHGVLDAQQTKLENIQAADLISSMPSGLSVFGPPIVKCLIESGGTGCTLADLMLASGASKSRVSSVLKILRDAGLVESERHPLAPSVHYAKRLDLFTAVKQELQPRQRTFGLGIHRADRNLERLQRCAERDRQLAEKEDDREAVALADKRLARLDSKRKVTVQQIHEWMNPKQVADHVHSPNVGHRFSKMSLHFGRKAPDQSPTAHAWDRLTELTGKPLLTDQEFAELYHLDSVLKAGVPFTESVFLDRIKAAESVGAQVVKATVKLSRHHEQLAFAQ